MRKDIGVLSIINGNIGTNIWERRSKKGIKKSLSLVGYWFLYCNNHTMSISSKNTMLRKSVQLRFNIYLEIIYLHNSPHNEVFVFPTDQTWLLSSWRWDSSTKRGPRMWTIDRMLRLNQASLSRTIRISIKLIKQKNKRAKHRMM